MGATYCVFVILHFYILAYKVCLNVNLYTLAHSGEGPPPIIAKAKFFLNVILSSRYFFVVDFFFNFKKSDILLARSARKRR